MDHEPMRTAAREQKRRDRLSANAACAFCGESDPFALLQPTDPKVARHTRHLLERHHVMGKKIDLDLTVDLCLNHHAQVTESMRRGGVAMEPRKNLLERFVQALKAVAAFVQSALHAIERWIAYLEKLIRDLDGHCPAWREVAE